MWKCFLICRKSWEKCLKLRNFDTKTKISSDLAITSQFFEIQNIFYLNFIWPKFEQNKRIFLDPIRHSSTIHPHKLARRTACFKISGILIFHREWKCQKWNIREKHKKANSTFGVPNIPEYSKSILWRQNQVLIGIIDHAN